MASTIASATVQHAAHVGKRIALRSISIHVSPPPVTFAERRSILQALEEHGKVEFFKPTENHDSLFVSLMKDEKAANELVAASPISYTVALPQASPETLLSDLKGRKSLANSTPVTTLHTSKPKATLKPNPTPSDGEDISSTEGWQQKEFEIHVWPLPNYKHQQSSQSALHRPWPKFVGDNNNFITRMLRQTVPNNLATRGLSNWKPDLGMRRVAATSNPAIEERQQKRLWLPGKLWEQATSEGQENQKSPPKDKSETTAR